MTDLGELRSVLTQVDRAGGCVHPVRLVGAVLDPATGEFWEGAVVVACKDRRAAVCPTCAARYRADAWHLVAAGLRGGKGVPGSVASHPFVFATFTAPSFGPVHASRSGTTHRGTVPCRPRRQEPVCPHGVPLACRSVHRPDDHLVGQPLCPECFDYRGAVLWNAHLGRLWDRTAILCRRGLARAGGLSERAAAGHLRLAYLKVAEFQHRGLVHLHVIVRVDGAEGPGSRPPDWATEDLLATVVREDGARAGVEPIDGGDRVVWGTECHVVPLGGPGGDDRSGQGAVASYLAKYTTKGSESSGALARRLDSPADPALLRLPPHLARLVSTAWSLGGEAELAPLRLRDHAHTFGYRGHFATKSRRYSTTMSALRAARLAHGRQSDSHQEADWQWAGRGYLTPRAATLARVLASADADRRRRTRRPLSAPHQGPEPVPQGFPGQSPDLPHSSDQG